MPEYRPGLESLHEVARGREKIASSIDGNPDKVWITWQDERLKVPEFGKAVFAFQKILHLLMPQNFLDVSYADETGVMVDKVPDTEDFIEANRIFAERRTRSDVMYGSDWILRKQDEIYDMDEYQEVAKLIGDILQPNGSEWGAREMAVPVNTAVVNGHPLIVELIRPVTPSVNGKLEQILVPTLKPEALEKVLAERQKNCLMTEVESTRIRRYYESYQSNVKQLIPEQATKTQVTMPRTETITPTEDMLVGEPPW